jgi:hypothetical protein
MGNVLVKVGGWEYISSSLPGRRRAMGGLVMVHSGARFLSKHTTSRTKVRPLPRQTETTSNKEEVEGRWGSVQAHKMSALEGVCCCLHCLGKGAQFQERLELDVCPFLGPGITDPTSVDVRLINITEAREEVSDRRVTFQFI